MKEERKVPLLLWEKIIDGELKDKDHLNSVFYKLDCVTIFVIWVNKKS